MKCHGFKSIALILCSGFVLGCHAVHDTPVDERPQQKLSSVGFEQIRKEILEPHCLNCHEKRHSSYSNYSVVRLASQRILQRIASKDPKKVMPPRSSEGLNEDQIRLLTEWIEAGAPRIANKPSLPEPENNVYFDRVKKDLLEPRCIGCHSHFRSYEIVFSEITSIYSQILNGKMPFPQKKGQVVEPLTQEQFDLMKNWVDGGAQFTKENPNPSTVILKLEPTWISLRNLVFGKKCILCHNSYGSRAPTAMESHSQLRLWWSKYPELFNIAQPEKSHFVGAILGRVDEDSGELFYDKMPFNSDTDDVQRDIPDVTNEELRVIQEWIGRGLPYDSEDQP
ncbi:MAG: hypothetical protein KDD61_03975 [Bdellovibrionales bacterium]|nr:hypothetical protein [Bdellovibrionales bacterium]